MKRPEVEPQTNIRDITGEIVYLNEMRRQNEVPKPFLELGDLAVQAYESQADAYPEDERPEIMDEYERFDCEPSRAVASCIALANELLALKDTDSQLTFVNIVVDANSIEVLEKLVNTRAGTTLAGEDEQMAIPSNGEYYPILDMRKQNMKLVGVGLRVWRWDYDKCVFTNKPGEKYKYPEHALFYPSNEKDATRQLELSFSYRNEESEGFSESVSLYIRANGSVSISSNVWSLAYAETGYEGHGGSSLDNPTDEDIVAFGDLVAEAVGDKPESISMRINSQLQELTSAAATSIAQLAIQELIEATWPAQACYFLKKEVEGTGETIAEQLRSESTAEAAVSAIHAIIEDWKARLS